MDRQYVAAVDLGTTKVVIAVARKVEKDKIEIVSLKEVPSEGILKGDVRNLESASQAIKNAKQQIEEELGENIRDVYVGLSGQHIRCSNKRRDISIGDGSGLSEITQADVDRLTQDTYNLCNTRERHVIKILPQSYKVDDEEGIINPVGMEGGRLEGTFKVIEGESAAIDRVSRCFERANLNVKNIILQPLASAEAVLSDDEKELGAVVVDIGGGTTDVCIYSDKIVRYVSVLAIGGTNINKDIKSIGILERHIEKLKVKFGEAVVSETNDDIICLPKVNQQQPREISKKDLVSIIEARMTDIVEWTKEQISICESDNSMLTEQSDVQSARSNVNISGGIILTGGGANLVNSDLLFKNALGINARVAGPIVHLAEGVSIEKYSDPKYSTIIGMLYEILKNSSIEESYRQSQRKRTTPGAVEGPVTTTYQEESEFEDDGDPTPKIKKRPSFFKRLMNSFSNFVSDEEI